MLNLFYKHYKIIFLIGLSIWLIGIFSPALRLLDILAFTILKFTYSIVCHQNPEKCFLINDSIVFVCARCLGIYVGAIVILISSCFIKYSSKLNLVPLIVFSIPMLFDVILTSLHIYHYNKIIALITGLLFGSISFIYISSVLENSFEELKKGVN